MKTEITKKEVREAIKLLKKVEKSPTIINDAYCGCGGTFAEYEEAEKTIKKWLKQINKKYGEALEE